MSPRAATALAVAAAIVVGLAVRLATWTAAIGSDDLTHAWAATHLWHDPIEHGMPDGPDSVRTRSTPAGSGSTCRWRRRRRSPGRARHLRGGDAGRVAARHRGVRALGRRAGRAAGRGDRRGAGRGAPIDAWQATIFLQDTLWAARAGATLAALAWGARHARWRWWFVAGLGFGYLQYVKESAAILVVALVVLGAARIVARAAARSRHAVALAGVARCSSRAGASTGGSRWATRRTTCARGSGARPPRGHRRGAAVPAQPGAPRPVPRLPPRARPRAPGRRRGSACAGCAAATRRRGCASTSR
jgi:hypothetical protein